MSRQRRLHALLNSECTPTGESLLCIEISFIIAAKPYKVLKTSSFLLFFLLLKQANFVDVAGEWEVWIPGAVTYTAKDEKVYRQYSPGAAMNKLAIKKDGTYTWGELNGKLEVVRPWYAAADKYYYRLRDQRSNSYDFWYKKETDQLVLLFGEVGGHAATGYRWGKTDIAPVAQAPTFEIKQKVEILWSGTWYKGSILDFKNGKYKVTYTGWGSTYDEWVEPEHIRKMER